MLEMLAKYDEGDLILDPMLLYYLRPVRPIVKGAVAGTVRYVDGEDFDLMGALDGELRISRKYGWETDKGNYALGFVSPSK